MSIEILNGPMSVYWAPVGEAFPAINAAPAGNWTLLGASGDKNYTDDGVVIETSNSHEFFRPLGSPFPRKAFLTESDVMVRVNMADMILGNIRTGMNQNAVTVDAGPPAIQHISFDVSGDVNDIALLIRGDGKSPSFATGAIQFELNRVIETGNHELTFVKGEPAAMALEFQALLDTANAIGRIVVQTA